MEAEEGVRGLMEENLQLLEEVYKHLCGALQGRRERVRRTPATVCGSCFSCIGLTLLNQIKVNILSQICLPLCLRPLLKWPNYAPCCSQLEPSSLCQSLFCLFLPPPPPAVNQPESSLSALQQLLQESLESLEENADHPLKRKSPYILKRQTGRTSKSRRPYILKRSAVY